MIVTHELIDQRLYELVKACVAKIDNDPTLITKAKDHVVRHPQQCPQDDWRNLLALPWPTLRQLLLENSQQGARLRQTVPFAGILSNSERHRIFQQFSASP
jgi:hypothetical protein